MSATNVLPEVPKATEIGGGIGLEAASLLENVQYNAGFKDGQDDMLSRMAAHALCKLEEMKRAAEIFYLRLLKIVPKDGILQHRLGWDYTTEDPATLTIISRKYDDKMADIQRAASECELDMVKRFDYDCYFWVITDEKLNESLIVCDFPYVREEKSHANAR